MISEKNLKWISEVLNENKLPQIATTYFQRKEILNQRNANKVNVRKELDNLRVLAVTPPQLLKLKNSKFRIEIGINDFSGIYIIYNPFRDFYYIGQSKNVFRRSYKHFVVNPDTQNSRKLINDTYGTPEIYHDYKAGDHFIISFVPLENTSFLSLDELESNAILAYDSLSPNGYNRHPGVIVEKPVFKSHDFEKAAYLLFQEIDGKEEIFKELTNDRKRIDFTLDLMSKLELPNNKSFAIDFIKLIKRYQKMNKVRA